MRTYIATVIASVAMAACASVETVAPAFPPPSTTTSESVSSGTVAPPLEMWNWQSLAALDWPSQQRSFRGYPGTVSNATWSNVYRAGGVELYCRIAFGRSEATDKRLNGVQLQLEHAYPAEAAARYFGYTSRRCNTPLPDHPRPDRASCLAATGDMQNLFPAYSSLNQSHGDSPYGELTGEGPHRRFTDLCADFERGVGAAPDLVEPTETARGDLARSLVYMHFVYGLPLERAVDDPNRLLSWMAADPVDEGELARERAIRNVQRDSGNPLVLSRDPQS